MIVSTARGAYNRFAKTYRAAKKKESQFVAFFKPWMVSPFMKCGTHCGWCSGETNEKTPCRSKYDLKRREFADQPWRFFQEYPEQEEEAFRESGRPRFVGLPPESDYTVLPFRGNIEWKDDRTLEFVPDSSGPLHLATIDPDPKGFYVIGADPSQGVGKDYASAHIMTIDDDGIPEIIGYYHSNIIHPTEFAASLDRIGRFFSGREWAAKLAVEDQGGQGSLPINELHRHLDYPNPYMHTSSGSKRSRGTRLFAFPMTVDRRKAVIDRLAKYLVVEDNETILRGIHPALRVELGQFVAQETANGNIRYAADVGCHDDLVMSLAIGLWVLVEEYTEASPEEAITEDVVWKAKNTINLSKFREDRDKMIEAYEEQQRQAMESFVMSSELLQTPRGYRG